MKPWENGLLRVSDNQRYLCNGDTPFFWLGDTAWLLFQQCTLEQAYVYLRNRRDMGYNVIQSVFYHPVQNREDCREESKVTNPAYWERCDKIIEMAEDLGLYMGLLPCWGNIVQDGIVNENNAEEYVTFIAKRYQDRKNIFWLIGGDVRGSEAPETFRIEGKTFKKLNPDKLVGYHPFGRTSSSLWFHEEEWLDFNMFQSGHRRYDQTSLGSWDDNAVKEGYFGEDNWKYVDRDLSYPAVKPTIDGEPSYEWILQGLHDTSQPYWREWDVRRYAYWSVFQGAMGHTYGSNAVMQFYDGTIPGSFGVREMWWEALHHVGAGQMKHLKDLMESVDYQKGRPAQELLLSGQKEKYERISVFAGPDFVFAYDYLGKGFTIDLRKFAGKKVGAYWFDPVSGIYSYFADMTGKEKAEVKPVARFTEDNDWVLVLKAE